MNATMEKKTTNGIDTENQQQIITLMNTQPAMAGITFKASNAWKGATCSTSTFSSFKAAGQEHDHTQTHTSDSDLPQLFLGTDDAPTPAEFALHALASCMNSTMVYNCAARGITVRSSRVEIEGDLDARGFLRLNDQVPAGYNQIRIRVQVDADAPAEEIQDLIEGSPMFKTFANPTPMNVSLKMI
ncbi:OsmC family protein [Pontiellaceae bacterium B12219]|nr:OsmC family protein [Pontiellaceae bacterium B12219]